jgi:hypothetical protein
MESLTLLALSPLTSLFSYLVQPTAIDTCKGHMVFSKVAEKSYMKSK